MERDNIYNKFIPLVKFISLHLSKFTKMQTRSGATSPILNTELLREFLTSPDGIAILNAHRPSFDPVSTVDYTSKQIALFRYMATCLKSTKS